MSNRVDNGIQSISISDISQDNLARHFFQGRIYAMGSYNVGTKLASIHITDEGIQGRGGGGGGGGGGKIKIEFKAAWAEGAMKRLSIGTIIRLSGTDGVLGSVTNPKTGETIPKLTYSKRVMGSIPKDNGEAPEEFVYDKIVIVDKPSKAKLRASPSPAGFSLEDGDDTINRSQSTDQAESSTGIDHSRQKLFTGNGFLDGQERVDCSAPSRSNKRSRTREKDSINSEEETAPPPPPQKKKKSTIPQAKKPPANTPAMIAAAANFKPPTGWPHGLASTNYKRYLALDQLANLDLGVPLTFFGVIAIVVDPVQEPTQVAKSGDWFLTLSLIDASNPHGAQDLDFKLFATSNAESFPLVGIGDVIVLQQLKMGKDGGSRKVRRPVGYKATFNYYVLKKVHLINSSVESILAQHSKSPKLQRADLTAAEIDYAKEMINNIDSTEVRVEIDSGMNEPVERIVRKAKPGRPLLMLKDVIDSQFCDLIVHVVKKHAPVDHGPETPIELYVTDYTENDRFYTYTESSDPTEIPPYLLGQKIMQVAVWPPHSLDHETWVPKKTVLHLKNVRPCETDYLEGKLHQDQRRPDQNNITVLNTRRNLPSGFGPAVESMTQRFKDVVEAYQKTLEMDQAGEVDSGVGEEMENPQSIAKIKNAPTFDRTAEVVPRAPLPSAGVVCQRNSIPLSTMDAMIESKLSDTKWHLRGRVVAYAPHRIEEFVTAICMDCEPLKFLNSAEQKCLENINHKIAYDYVFSIEIEEAPNGADDDDTTELKKITVVISDETPDVIYNLPPNAEMREDNGSSSSGALRARLAPVFGPLQYRRNVLHKGAVAPPYFDFVVKKTILNDDEEPLYQFSETSFQGGVVKEE